MSKTVRGTSSVRTTKNRTNIESQGTISVADALNQLRSFSQMIRILYKEAAESLEYFSDDEVWNDQCELAVDCLIKYQRLCARIYQFLTSDNIPMTVVVEKYSCDDKFTAAEEQIKVIVRTMLGSLKNLDNSQLTLDYLIAIRELLKELPTGHMLVKQLTDCCKNIRKNSRIYET